MCSLIPSLCSSFSCRILRVATSDSGRNGKHSFFAQLVSHLLQCICHMLEVATRKTKTHFELVLPAHHHKAAIIGLIIPEEDHSISAEIRNLQVILARRGRI